MPESTPPVSALPPVTASVTRLHASAAANLLERKVRQTGTTPVAPSPPPARREMTLAELAALSGGPKAPVPSAPSEADLMEWVPERSGSKKRVVLEAESATPQSTAPSGAALAAQMLTFMRGGKSRC